MRTFSGLKASQNEHELRQFIEFLQSKNVTSYLEIGSRHGDAFHEVVRHLPEGSRAVAVDLPGGVWGRRESLPVLKFAANSLRGKGYEITLIIGNSQSRKTVEQVRALGPFDAVFIDGDHTIQGVKADFMNYRDMATYVGFHDIAGRGQRERTGKTVDVQDLWEEIRHDGCSEFIHPGSKMGIGVWTSQS